MPSEFEISKDVADLPLSVPISVVDAAKKKPHLKAMSNVSRRFDESYQNA